jgi:hypothetical protein
MSGDDHQNDMEAASIKRTLVENHETRKKLNTIEEEGAISEVVKALEVL